MTYLCTKKMGNPKKEDIIVTYNNLYYNVFGQVYIVHPGCTCNINHVF